MTIWEKALVNLQKGFEKFTSIAAVFSERVKAELNIVHTRIRMDSIQARIDELHRIIGSSVVELRNKAASSKGLEQLLKNEDVAAALAEIAEKEKELEDLKAEVKEVEASFKSAPKQAEDQSI